MPSTVAERKTNRKIYQALRNDYRAVSESLHITCVLLGYSLIVVCTIIPI